MRITATGMGTAVKYFPHPVVIGFTNGIAVLIASTQIKDFFGLKIESVPGDFLARIETIARHFGTISWPTTLLGIGSLALIILAGKGKIIKGVPGTVVAMFAGTIVAFAFKLPVETIFSRFGEIPRTLPQFHVPEFKPELIPVLFPSALTVALLGAIESLLCAVVADRMTKDRHNPNVELIGQFAPGADAGLD